MQQRDDKTSLYSPTHLVNFLGSAHSTILDLRAIISQSLKRDEISDSDKLLQQKGQEHETTYLQRLKAYGKIVAEISRDIPVDERTRLTTEAMRKGVDVVYQAALYAARWGGYADFLNKTNAPSRLGPFSYEATDTKLARQFPRVKHLVQLGVYSRSFGHLPGYSTGAVVILFSEIIQRASFQVKDFASYVRHAVQRLEAFAASPPSFSYPEPCSHCSTCHWNETCTGQRENDDHLSLVASIQRTQVAKLERAGVKSVNQLAALRPETRIPDLNPEVLERLRAQAALQDHKRRTGENKHELLDPEPGRGFFRLPTPNAGDLFFDMEGDPLHPEGLEYLFGLCFLTDGELEFKSFWAHDHEEERVALGQFYGSFYRNISPPILKRISTITTIMKPRHSSD